MKKETSVRRKAKASRGQVSFWKDKGEVTKVHFAITGPQRKKGNREWQNTHGTSSDNKSGKRQRGLSSGNGFVLAVITRKSATKKMI